ncbi:MAG: transposase [Muribaculaceae bacterium]|nr:transposase [Muribaculaceae bacterium]
MDYLCHMEDKRGEQRKQWWERHHTEHKVRRSMKRRNAFHDYRSRCIYMITLTVEGRRPVLGELLGPDKSHVEAWIKPSLLGERVMSCWREIAIHYPEVKPMEIQLMPDHMHGILFVTKQMPYHLGQVVNGFKIGCNAAARELLGTTLWEEGYHDRILSHEGQLVTMVRYLQDNPRRLWLKRHHPEFFTVQHEVTIENNHVALAGNRFLLDYPIKVAVQCSRSINSEEAIAREVNRYLDLARDGAVLVSACISPCEKAVMRAAFDAGVKEIVLLENGFSPMWKPGGKQFDACARGQLLFVAPWPYHSERKTITRTQCLQLNELAKEIATIQPQQ